MTEFADEPGLTGRALALDPASVRPAPLVPAVRSPWLVAERARRRQAAWSQHFRLGLVLTDAAMVSAAVVLSYVLTGLEVDDRVNGLRVLSYKALLPVVALLWLISLEAVSSRQASVLGAGPEEFRRVLKATALLFGGLALSSYVFDLSLSRRLFLVLLPLGAASLLLGRWGVRQVLIHRRARGLALLPTLVVGSADEVTEVVQQLRRATGAGLLPQGVCLAGGSAAPDEKGVEGLHLLDRHSPADLEEVARSGRYEAVVIAEGVDRAQIQRLAWHLENQSTSLLMVPQLADVAGPRLSIWDAQGLALVHVDLPRYAGWKSVAKRAFDIIFSAAALVLVSPVLAAVAVAVVLDDRGPVIFRQERIGRRGEVFTIHKFRTMCVDAEGKIDTLIDANGGKALLFKLEDDPRITRVGKILRKYSLDELPQFWTVLRGAMSVVGPRPQVAREVAEYVDAYHRRLLIKPGITGLWQVSGRSQLSMDESIRLDLRYVENWSLLNDLLIVFRTVRVLLKPAGAF